MFLLTALPALAGPAYILVDVSSGAVLANRDAGDLWYPASVTKLMTSYVTFRALKSGRATLDSMVTVSAHALAEPPSKMGFPAGTAVNFDNALKMMLVHSSNDIAMAIAETIGGSEERFVAMMNAEAARLGMNSTRFDNPNGLPDASQHTTARDLAVLTRAIWLEFPEYRSYFSIPAIKSGRRVLRSQNMLLERYRGTNGMKTGFICSSGFNMVVTATRNGRTLMVVVLGASTPILRAETAAKLLDQGFQGLSLGPEPSLASFHAGRTAGNPVDLHDQICGKRPKQTEDDPALIAGSAADSALEQRFVLMQPVVVYTGPTKAAVAAKPAPAAKPVAVAKPAPVANPAAAATKPAAKAAATTPAPAGVPAPRVPLPRPRPRAQMGAGASADAPAPTL